MFWNQREMLTFYNFHVEWTTFFDMQYIYILNSLFMPCKLGTTLLQHFCFDNFKAIFDYILQKKKKKKGV
jgi:hypothetical protein